MDKDQLKTTRRFANLKAGRTDWYRIENLATGGTAKIYIYDEIGYFGVTAADFIRELNTLSVDSLEVHLNTPGGDVMDGIAILNALRNHPAQVTVICDSAAYSIGSVIMQAGDKRIMSKNSSMMIHDASGLCIGNAIDMTKMTEILDKASDNIATVYAEKAGGTMAEWRGRMAIETWYSDTEAVAAGLADEVQGDAASSTNSFDLSIYNFKSREEAPAPLISPVVENSKTPPAETSPVFSFDPELYLKSIKEAVK